ncbi:hypothetical protein [Arenibacter sp. F20364]|nr:hypothetical protein [Arenibacter sp. F20364]MCK0190937.1 hypothetical protein [Arenibacter sp. F20364]
MRALDRLLLIFTSNNLLKNHDSLDWPKDCSKYDHKQDGAAPLIQL